MSNPSKKIIDTSPKFSLTMNTPMKMTIAMQTNIHTKMNITLLECGMTQNSPYYIPTQMDIQTLQIKMPILFKLQDVSILSQTVVKYEPKSNFWQIITSVGVTITGCLAYLIPGVGFVVGSALTSAGISGFIKSISQPGLGWDQFAKQMGIQAVVGMATSIISKLGSASKILSNTRFQAAIKGAILGALTGTVAELVRMGFDPNKKFEWSSVLVQSIISAAVSLMKFKDLSQVKEKDKFAQIRQKLGQHWQQKKKAIQTLDTRWNACLYKLSEQQSKMFPQLAGEQFAIPHNQGIVHFLDYNSVAQLVKQKGTRLPLIAQILNAGVSPEKGYINGYLSQITAKMDEIISKTNPNLVEIVTSDKLKQVVKNGVNINTVIESMRNSDKIPYGISRIYYHLPQNVERGLKIITYTDIRTNIQKFSTVMPLRAKDIAKQLKKLHI